MTEKSFTKRSRKRDLNLLILAFKCIFYFYLKGMNVPLSLTAVKSFMLRLAVFWLGFPGQKYVQKVCLWDS